MFEIIILLAFVITGTIFVIKSFFDLKNWSRKGSDFMKYSTVGFIASLITLLGLIQLEYALYESLPSNVSQILAHAINTLFFVFPFGGIIAIASSMGIIGYFITFLGGWRQSYVEKRFKSRSA